MKRRGFFGALLGLPAAVKAAAMQKQPEIKLPPKPVELPPRVRYDFTMCTLGMIGGIDDKW